MDLSFQRRGKAIAASFEIEDGPDSGKMFLDQANLQTFKAVSEQKQQILMGGLTCQFYQSKKGGANYIYSVLVETKTLQV